LSECFSGRCFLSNSRRIVGLGIATTLAVSAVALVLDAGAINDSRKWRREMPDHMTGRRRLGYPGLIKANLHSYRGLSEVGHCSKDNTESCLVRRNNGTERSGTGRMLLSLVSALTITPNCRGIRENPRFLHPIILDPKIPQYSRIAKRGQRRFHTWLGRSRQINF